MSSERTQWQILLYEKKKLGTTLVQPGWLGKAPGWLYPMAAQSVTPPVPSSNRKMS